uniref:Uncharacterized protein n=1 Tax=viral metagenome TaxID=1070528 RepID=A0A6M3LB37_9ZZZZ
MKFPKGREIGYDDFHQEPIWNYNGNKIHRWLNAFRADIQKRVDTKGCFCEACAKEILDRWLTE